VALSFPVTVAKDFATGVVTWVAGSYSILLATNAGYTYSSAHDFRNDFTTEHTNFTGYVAGTGLVIDNKTASSANPCVLSADDEVIAQSGGGASDIRKYGVFKITGGASSTDPYFFYGAFGADVGNVAGALTLDVPTSMITITV
jgi:hypothetical protein